MSTRASIADAYIVVLDAAAGSVRALLFDPGAWRVEGYSVQLPKRADTAADLLDEMHRLVQAAGFRVGAVVGRADSEVTAEDREYWPAFAEAEWFPALPEGAGMMLGSGCVGRERFGLMLGENSMLGAVVENPPETDGLRCARIDEKRFLVSQAIPEAGLAYSNLRQASRGSVERYLETLDTDDPHLAAFDAAARHFGAAYHALSRRLGEPTQVIACGAALLGSPALAQRIAHALGASVTLSTEPEVAGRGAALWALERIGAIENLRALKASMGAVYAVGKFAAGQMD